MAVAPDVFLRSIEKSAVIAFDGRPAAHENVGDLRRRRKAERDAAAADGTHAAVGFAIHVRRRRDHGLLRPQAAERGEERRRHAMDRRRQDQHAVSARPRRRSADALADRDALPPPRLHAHPAARTRPRPLRPRHLPARRRSEAGALAGVGVHARAHHHAGADGLRRRVAFAAHRRAAHRAVDRLCRGREHLHVEAARRGGRWSSSVSACCTGWDSPAC